MSDASKITPRTADEAREAMEQPTWPEPGAPAPANKPPLGETIRARAGTRIEGTIQVIEWAPKVGVFVELPAAELHSVFVGQEVAVELLEDTPADMGPSGLRDSDGDDGE